MRKLYAIAIALLAAVGVKAASAASTIAATGSCPFCR